ncbi:MULTISPECIES: hypothetical protein [Dehalobacter]|nr:MULTISPECIES: hypothetical protein [Dehalobacter]MDJ0306912.1 hypothetical protein [Dehalobacter sp.]
MKKNLENVIPKICDYFENDDFKAILTELEFYHTHVQEHYNDFENTKSAWLKIIKFLKNTEKVYTEKSCPQKKGRYPQVKGTDLPIGASFMTVKWPN